MIHVIFLLLKIENHLNERMKYTIGKSTTWLDVFITLKQRGVLVHFALHHICLFASSYPQMPLSVRSDGAPFHNPPVRQAYSRSHSHPSIQPPPSSQYCLSANITPETWNPKLRLSCCWVDCFCCHFLLIRAQRLGYPRFSSPLTVLDKRSTLEDQGNV